MAGEVPAMSARPMRSSASSAPSGCAFGQGFLFAQPLGAEEAELLIGRADMAGTSPAN